MSLNSDHPGAHHYYIHMVELPQPDLAVPSAEKLGSLIPAAGHLVHMPSHIYIRVGRYEEAAKANIEAIAADEDYISQCLSQGISSGAVTTYLRHTRLSCSDPVDGFAALCCSFGSAASRIAPPAILQKPANFCGGPNK